MVFSYRIFIAGLGLAVPKGDSLTWVFPKVEQDDKLDLNKHKFSLVIDKRLISRRTNFDRFEEIEINDNHYYIFDLDGHDIEILGPSANYVSRNRIPGTETPTEDNKENLFWMGELYDKQGNQPTVKEEYTTKKYSGKDQVLTGRLLQSRGSLSINSFAGYNGYYLKRQHKIETKIIKQAITTMPCITVRSLWYLRFRITQHSNQESSNIWIRPRRNVKREICIVNLETRLGDKSRFDTPNLEDLNKILKKEHPVYEKILDINPGNLAIPELVESVNQANHIPRRIRMENDTFKEWLGPEHFGDKEIYGPNSGATSAVCRPGVANG